MVGQRKELNMGAKAQMAKQRAKLSTTVAPETYEFLQQMVEAGQAATLAEALDVVIGRIRRLDNRLRLARATTQYFEHLDKEALAEEQALAADFSSAAGAIDFEHDI